jgi:hypothetical protein
MHYGLRTGAFLLVAAVGLATSGCATRESVEHAQATADQALSTAQQAQQTATSAMSAAQAAQQGVDQLNQRVNALEAERHKGERG